MIGFLVAFTALVGGFDPRLAHAQPASSIDTRSNAATEQVWTANDDYVPESLRD